MAIKGEAFDDSIKFHSVATRIVFVDHIVPHYLDGMSYVKINLLGSLALIT